MKLKLERIYHLCDLSITVSNVNLKIISWREMMGILCIFQNYLPYYIQSLYLQLCLTVEKK